MERVLALPDVTTLLGLRDRAMLETLYSTGMRRQELITLALSDVDQERGTVLIREGKGKKDRLIPIGERALAWIDAYLTRVRPLFAVPPDGGTLFLTRRGRRLRSNRLTELVYSYLDVAGLGNRGSCHVFRHTMATLMLEGGADVRYIQEMLGHAQLNTTERYTRVAIRSSRRSTLGHTRRGSRGVIALFLFLLELLNFQKTTTPQRRQMRMRCARDVVPPPARGRREEASRRQARGLGLGSLAALARLYITGGYANLGRGHSEVPCVMPAAPVRPPRGLPRTPLHQGR